MQESAKQHIFITGATGCLGAELLPRLLRGPDARITVLHRDTSSSRRAWLRLGGDAKRVEQVTGDIAKPNLGLTDNELHRLRESVDEIWHLAAQTRFEEVLRPLIFNVNVQGTEHVLQFASQLKRLRCFNHVSTAYAAGRAKPDAVVLERFGPKPAAFRNPYEESKYEAERRVRASGLPHLIYRPSIVLANPALGIDAGQTVYGVAKMARLAKLMDDRGGARRGTRANTVFRVVGNAAAVKNIMPVNAVVNAMLRIRAASTPAGGIFHITHPEPGTMADLVESIAGLLDLKGCALVPELDTATASIAERAFNRMARGYAPYMLGSDPVFDASNTRRVLGGLDVPAVDAAYLRRCVHQFYTRVYGEDYAMLPETEAPAVA